LLLRLSETISTSFELLLTLYAFYLRSSSLICHDGDEFGMPLFTWISTSLSNLHLLNIFSMEPG